jgi:signal transduction histidine kinase
MLQQKEEEEEEEEEGPVSRLSPAAVENSSSHAATAAHVATTDIIAMKPRGRTSDECQVVEEIMESCDEALTILNDLLMYEKMEDGGGFVLEKKEEPILFLIQSVSTTAGYAILARMYTHFCACNLRLEVLEILRHLLIL